MRQILKILFLFSTTIFVNQYKNHTNILINIKIVGHTQLFKNNSCKCIGDFKHYKVNKYYNIKCAKDCK